MESNKTVFNKILKARQISSGPPTSKERKTTKLTLHIKLVHRELVECEGNLKNTFADM